MRVKLFFLLLFVCILVLNCSKVSELRDNKTDPIISGSIPVDSVKKAMYDLTQVEKTNLFESVPSVTILKRQDLPELSGLESSRTNPDLLYTVEDSGNLNEIYLTNSKGENLGKIVLDGISNRDWEDLASGPGPENSKNYLYVGEIGDNDWVYPGIIVYRFPEPALTATSPQMYVHVVPDALKFTYPKSAVNAESLFLDPWTKDLYILTKEVGESNLFVARYPQSTTVVTKLIQLASFPFDHLTSADISADGTEILVRNNSQIWYWKRMPNESVLNTLLRVPLEAPYFNNERQGEAICFAADGTGYFTVSETKKYPGAVAALTFYKRN